MKIESHSKNVESESEKIKLYLSQELIFLRLHYLCVKPLRVCA